jgi:hypothetical protein
MRSSPGYAFHFIRTGKSMCGNRTKHCLEKEHNHTMLVLYPSVEAKLKPSAASCRYIHIAGKGLVPERFIVLIMRPSQS